MSDVGVSNEDVPVGPPWRPIFKLCGAATLLYFLVTCFIHFPFLADDYFFLWKSYTNEFVLSDFWWLSKRPLSALIDFISFKVHLFEYTQFPFVFYFMLHSIGLLCIVAWLQAHLGKSRPGEGRAWWLAGAICLLYPCFHEVLYMATNLPYSLGLFFLGVGIWQKRKRTETVLLLLSFLCLETYVLPAFILAAIDLPRSLYRSLRRNHLCRQSFAAQLTRLLSPTLALAGYFLISRSMGRSDYGADFSLAGILNRVPALLKLLWTIHFYKEQWIATFVEGAVYLFLSIQLVRLRTLSWSLAISAPVIFFLSAFQGLLLPYYAPRAIHGAVALKLAFLTFLLLEYLSSSTRQLARISIAALLGVAYCGQLAFIFHSKAYNYRILEQRQTELTSEMANCPEPCVLTVNDVSKGLLRDWIMPSYAVEPLLMWIRDKHFPGKNIKFIVQ